MVSRQDKLVGPAAVTLTFLLVGLSTFVLLIACANLANLLVARAVSRVREFAIRSALGASASQLVRPLAVECLLIAATGGALGIQLSVWTTEWLGARLSREGPPIARPGQEPTAYANAVTPEYFDTVGTPIVRGRSILPGDTRESPPVVVINETMARILFPKGDAMGHRLAATGDSKAEWAEIVGVARDVRFISVKALPTVFQVYRPLSQETWGSVGVTVRAKDAASAPGLVEPIRRTIAEFDRDLPVVNLMPVPAYILRSNEDLASVNELLVGFAALGF